VPNYCPSLVLLFTIEGQYIQCVESNFYKCSHFEDTDNEGCKVVVFRRDSPGKVAQWIGRSIRECLGVFGLVIRLLSVRVDACKCISYRSSLYSQVKKFSLFESYVCFTLYLLYSYFTVYFYSLIFCLIVFKHFFYLV
jgi:hypothetical protein